MSRCTSALLVVALACLGCFGGCTQSEGDPPSASRSLSEGTSSEDATATDQPRPPDLPQTSVAAPIRSIELDDVPLLRVDPDVSALPQGPPARLPWFEYVGNPEFGRSIAHWRDTEFATRTSVYPRRLLWWGDGLAGIASVKTVDAWVTVGLDGTVTHLPRTREAPHETLVFGRDRIAWAHPARPPQAGHAVEVLERGSAEPRPVVLPSWLDPDQAVVTPAFFLRSGELVVRVVGSAPARRGFLVATPTDEILPLPARAVVAGSPASGVVLLAGRRRGDVWAYDTETFAPLWSRSFTEGGRRVLPELSLTPSGRRVVVDVLGDRIGEGVTLLLDALTGRAIVKVDVPSPPPNLYTYSGRPHFEDDEHLLLDMYDGPLNPAYDPADTFPDLSELDYVNTLVRCDLRGSCEAAARVGRGRALLFGGEVVGHPGG